jgi:hypothetical protein
MAHRAAMAGLEKITAGKSAGASDHRAGFANRADGGSHLDKNHEWTRTDMDGVHALQLRVTRPLKIPFVRIRVHSWFHPI